MKLKVTAGVQSGALQAQTRVEIPDSVLARAQGLVSRGVRAAEIDEDGNLVFTLTDGSRVNLGRVVGSNGKDGATIREVEIDTLGCLCIEYGTDTESTLANLGRVVGSNGHDGDSVRNARVTEDGELVLTIGNGLAAYDCNVGKVVGAKGEPGYTPVKGVDYFTESDVQEIAEAAAELVEGADSPADRIMSESGDCAIYVNRADGLSVVEKLETITQAGVYTLYVQKGCPDNPAGSEAIGSSLRGICHITLTKDANGAMYAWILLFDQTGQAYSRYTSASGSGAWVAHSGDSGSGSGAGYTIGAGLKLDTATNTLSVDTTDSVEEDNTKPITSAAVATTVGNIEVILGTI